MSTHRQRVGVVVAEPDRLRRQLSGFRHFLF
jgi:hypothetical protein